MNNGQCLFYGASFSNHTTKGGTVSVATTNPPESVIATPITQVRAGCLSCHNNTTQYNGYAGRWKSDYLKQGHKNMLRKVTPGQNWAGPNADGVLEIYTEAAGQTLDFAAGTATGSYGTKPLMYLFGDWMAPAPDGLDTVVWHNGQARYNGSSGYSCASCHTTGWRNDNTAIGVCDNSAKTTQATCTSAGGTWYPSSGTQGYGIGGAEPAASWPGYLTGPDYGHGPTVPGITGQWDHDGINCNRCHKVAYDPSLPINDQGVNAPPGYTTHETDIFSGETIVNICFGCHQSIAKANNGTATWNDIADATKIPVKNTATAPAYVPEWNSHVLGASFLNSPHARYTGGLVPNALGKYDLAPGGTFDSSFKGKVCRSSTTAGGGSVLETKSDGHVIASLQDCNRANGKPVGDNVSYGYWQDETGPGNCTTCHNVHESLFVADAKEPLRRECTTCHDKSIPQMAHPMGGGTPDGLAGGNAAKACEICHMPKATSGGFPMHLWRVNSSASYSTFPTAAEFNGNTKKVGNTSPDGSYANAVWVDVDYACGQCHGGSFGAGATKNGAFYKTKSELATLAATIHNDGPAASFGYTLGPSSLTVNVNASTSYCPSGNCTYDWNWNDATPNGAGVSTSHTYATGGTKTVALTVTDTGFGTSSSVSHDVTVVAPDLPPTVGGTACDSILNGNTWVATLVDSSTDDQALQLVTVNWGDGGLLSRNPPYTHTYFRAGTFKITQTAYDNVGQQSKRECSVTVNSFTISGTVKQSNNSTVVPMAKVAVMSGATTVRTVYTSPTGTFTVNTLKPGSYTLRITKVGYTFADVPITVGPDSPGNNILATTP